MFLACVAQKARCPVLRAEVNYDRVKTVFVFIGLGLLGTRFEIHLKATIWGVLRVRSLFCPQPFVHPVWIWSQILETSRASARMLHFGEQLCDSGARGSGLIRLRTVGYSSAYICRSTGRNIGLFIQTDQRTAIQVATLRFPPIVISATEGAFSYFIFGLFPWTKRVLALLASFTVLFFANLFHYFSTLFLRLELRCLAGGETWLCVYSECTTKVRG